MASYLLLALIIMSGSSLDVPPGETPSKTYPGEWAVDDYDINNENAGATPYANRRAFDAFGGRDGVARVMARTVKGATSDPRIEKIFRASDHKRIERTLTEQVCYLLGGPCPYTGRDMPAIHKDHGITTAEFNALVEIMQAAMDAEGVPFWAQNRLLAKLAPMHRDIVTR